MRLKYLYPIGWSVLPRVAACAVVLYEFPGVNWHWDLFDVGLIFVATLLGAARVWRDMQGNREQAAEARLRERYDGFRDRQAVARQRRNSSGK